MGGCRMSDHHSLSERRQEAERARANLAQTVDELRAKASPAGLSAGFKDTISRTVRENPLPTLALGMAVGYPLLKIVRAAPAPLLMIGAGLFLSGTATGKEAGRKAAALGADASDKLSRMASDVAQTAKEKANVGLAAAREQASAAADTLGSSAAVARDAAQSAREQANAGLATARERASAAADMVGAALGAAADTAKDKASAAADASAEAQNTISSAAGQAWAQVPSRDQLTGAVEKARATAVDAFRQNPLLVGGVGLAIGALVASALPSSRIEQQWIGDAADRVKDSAREAAEQAYENAKKAASAAIDSAAERASEDGFSAESLKTAAADYIERARKVANSALDAAAQQSGEKPH